MKQKALDYDYETIINITDKTKERHCIKKKTNLYKKFDNLKNAIVNNINNNAPAKKVIKEGVINLPGKGLNESKIRV